ncbi:MAG: hypothetical protein AAFO75_02040 [Pseudomonadota bacterium]
MNRLRIAVTPICVIALSVLATPVHAMPKALSCTFKTGNSGSYEAGGFRPGQAKPLSFSIQAIDLQRQSAELPADADKKPGTLRIVRALNANHFIEAINEGFLNLTTVYDADATTGQFPAVHSRHFGVLGQALYAQYTGFCTKQ